MEIIDSKKTYRAPMAKVVEIKVQRVLCQSQNGQTEGFTVNGDNATYESDWE